MTLSYRGSSVKEEEEKASSKPKTDASLPVPPFIVSSASAVLLLNRAVPFSLTRKFFNRAPRVASASS